MAESKQPDPGPPAEEEHRYEHVALPNARFIDADLGGAVFDDVNLRRATFENVALDGASLRNVSLKNVAVADAALEGMTIGGVLVSELLRAHVASRQGPQPAAAVLYAKDLPRMVAFYTSVPGLSVEQTEDDHALLASTSLQLSIVQIPARLAADIEIAVPPQRREGTPIKLAFAVASIAAAREAAGPLGGVVDPPEREWVFQGGKVCDGHDPEGNVLQLREAASPVR